MTGSLSRLERDKLIQAARTAALFAYAPYSKFRVGAAVLGDHGIEVGANIENASYGLALCAERAALANAVAKGEKNLRAIAIACIDATQNQGINELLPCGACRQWLVELAPDAVIVICGNDQVQEFTVDELMPNPFRLGNAV